MQGEPTKDAVRRLRSKVKIAFDEPKFSQPISDLRNSRNDLKILLENRTENAVYLNLIFSCIRQDLIQLLSNIFRLYVRSQLLDHAIVTILRTQAPV